MSATVETKRCSRCNRDLPATEQYFRRRTASGPLQSWCRECHRAYDRDRAARRSTGRPRGAPLKYSSEPERLIKEIVGRLRALRILLAKSPVAGRSSPGRPGVRKSDSAIYCAPFGGRPGRPEREP